MTKTYTRMLAIVLSAVMAVSSFTGFGGDVNAYAAENPSAVVAETDEVATPTDASEFKAKVWYTSTNYYGGPIRPGVEIRNESGKMLKEGTDYTLSYKDNVLPGTAKVIITYKGHYKGSSEKTFNINKLQIERFKASSTHETSFVLSWKNLNATMSRYVVFQYKNGKWQAIYTCDETDSAAEIYKLTPNTAYKYCVKAQRKLASGKYVDVAKSSVITARTKPYSASYTDIKMSKKTFVYDGNAKKPSFKVIGNITSKGVTVDPKKEYTYAYANNLYPGTATLKVKYTANSRFKGTRTENFKIVPAKISGIKSKRTTNSITLTYPAVKGATEYRLYGTDHDLDYPREEKYKVVGKSKTNTITIKNRKQGSEYRFYLRAYVVKNGKEIMLAKSDEFVERTTPAKVTGVVSGKTEKNGKYTAVRTGTNYVEIGCTPVAGVDGYYIYRYDSKNKKWVKVLNDDGYYDKKTKKVYFMVENLKTGTGYMFKIAAYKWRWTSPDSRGNLVGPASQTIIAATVPKTQYKYTYVEKWNDPFQAQLYYNVKLGGCSKNKGYYVILNKMRTDSSRTVYKPYKVIKTNKSTVRVNVPMRTSPNDPLYGITVKPYIQYGGKVFVGAEEFQYGGNMK